MCSQFDRTLPHLGDLCTHHVRKAIHRKLHYGGWNYSSWLWLRFAYSAYMSKYNYHTLVLSYTYHPLSLYFVHLFSLSCFQLVHFTIRLTFHFELKENWNIIHGILLGYVQLPFIHLISQSQTSTYFRLIFHFRLKNIWKIMHEILLWYVQYLSFIWCARIKIKPGHILVNHGRYKRKKGFISLGI